MRRAIEVSLMAAAFLCFSAGPAGAGAPSPGFQVGKTYHGFKLQKDRTIPEIAARGLLFQHVRSGARLVKFEAADPNKVFSISFATPPPDDAGLPHILEHSVLNGSRKFPVKSPFQELLKGSLNTFLNAMTGSDFTMYPVASTNAKDFFNLMDVYLDAVLYPRIHQEPRILRQEGWRYELESPEGPLTYNGIVYNEMKGVFSAPESVLSLALDRLLFPDTPYGRESGGLPEAIPSLTDKQFTDFHKTYYHPSNARILLWGDGDTRAELEFIDGKYLRDFKASKFVPAFPSQRPPAEPLEARAEYPIAADEAPAGKTYLALAWVAGGPTDPALAMALDVLADALVNRPAAPVRQALERAGIGKDVYASYDDRLQGVWRLVVQNAEEAEADRFREVVQETLTRVSEQGLEPRLVEGVLNSLEFRLREADWRGLPIGLVYAWFGMRGWLFADDPFLGVAFEAPLARVRAWAKEGGLEKLIREHLLENAFRARLIVVPRPGLEEELSRRTAERLAEVKKNLSPADLERIAAETRALKEWQKTPDRPEDLAKIPMLARADLGRDEPRWEAAEHVVDGVRVMHAEQATKGIVYLRLMFDTRRVPEEFLPYLNVLNAMLAEVDTLERGYAELDAEIHIHTGGISTFPQVFVDARDPGVFLPTLTLSGKALTPRLERLLAVLGEIALKSRFDDRARVRDVLRKLDSQYESWARNAGVQMAMMRLQARLGRHGAHQEVVSGLSFLQALGGLVQGYPTSAADLQADLAMLSGLIFDRQNLVIGVTCSAEDFARVRAALPAFLAGLPASDRPRQEYRLSPPAGNEGLLAASKVQYVVQGGDFRASGRAYDGKLALVQRVLGRDYLTEKIRVQGGAYGAFASFGRDGSLLLASYRDPNLTKTLEAYRGVVDYLKGFSPDERDMTRFVIGAISDRDRPLTPSMRGERAFSNLLTGLEYSQLQKEREDILAATPADLQALAPLVEAVLGQNLLCVYGDEAVLTENQSLFQSLVKVLR
jgi:hypothetical protein